jgi:hypothetical protein
MHPSIKTLPPPTHPQVLTLSLKLTEAILVLRQKNSPNPSRVKLGIKILISTIFVAQRTICGVIPIKEFVISWKKSNRL